jgi:transposase
VDNHDYTLGVDLACSAVHVATLADAGGRLVWSNFRFRTGVAELEVLWAKVPAGARLQVVMEPTRNAWVPLAAWFRCRGATVILVPPEQSADLRRYFQKHTKNDRLDSVLLARLPLLHPDGLNACHSVGPADPLRRAVRRRTKLVDQRITSLNRLTALLELLGPTYPEVFAGALASKTAYAVLSRYADPRKLLRTPPARLRQVVSEASRGHHGPALIDRLRGAASEAVALYAGAEIDFAELAADIEAEVRFTTAVQAEIDQLDQRIERLYAANDPERIVQTVPGVGATLAPAIHALFGDPHRFANLGAARAFTGLVPSTNESGLSQAPARPTKTGDPGLRTALFMAADLARQTDPTLAAKYRRLILARHLHHTSAVCHLAAVLATRIVACLRSGTPYQIRSLDGRLLTQAEGRALAATLKVQPHERSSAHSRRKAGQTKKEVATRLVA